MKKTKDIGCRDALAVTIPALALCYLTRPAAAADKWVEIHSARVMSQSMPWMAQEAGLFKKYNLDFNQLWARK